MTTTTITASLNANLLPTAVGAAVMLLAIVLYRVVHIVVGLVLDAVLSVAMPPDRLQRMGQLGLLGYAAQFVSVVCLSAVRLAAAMFHAVCLVGMAMLPFLVLSCILALMEVRWYDTMAVLTDALDGGPLSSSLHALVLTPLAILDSVGSAVLPVYNLIVLVVFQAPLRLLMWLLRGVGAAHLSAAFQELRLLVPALASSARAFVEANQVDISFLTRDCVSALTANNASFTCIPQTAAAQALLDPVARELALVEPFWHARMAAAHVVIGLGDSCAALGLLLNVTLFPLTDTATWYAIDRAINAVLAVAVVAPTTTAQRCALAGGFQARPAMCTPDMGHAFELAADAALRFGQVITHWLDSLYVLLFERETIERACAAGNDYSGLWEDPLMRGLFGANRTVLVRTSDTTFALTDGVSAVFVTEEPLSKTYAPLAWPVPVDPRFGIARPGNIEYVVPASFSLDAEAQLLTCDRVRVNVESLRWQRTRAAVRAVRARTTARALDTADVAVWLTPICGAQSGPKALACLPSSLFTRGICMPYCLGIRLAREGFGKNLTLRGAEEWTSGVLLTGRDCSSSSSNSGSISPSSAPAGAAVRTVCSIGADVSGSALPQESVGAASSCSFASTCTSFATNRSFLLTTRTTAAAPPFFDLQDGASRLVLPTQPLIIAGGTCIAQMMPSTSEGDTTTTITQQLGALSLVGDTQDEFFMESPATAPLPVTSGLLGPWQQRDAVQKATVDPPTSYVQANGVVPINPATLLPDGSIMYVILLIHPLLYKHHPRSRSRRRSSSSSLLIRAGEIVALGALVVIIVVFWCRRSVPQPLLIQAHLRVEVRHGLRARLQTQPQRVPILLLFRGVEHVADTGLDRSAHKLGPCAREKVVAAASHLNEKK